MKTMLVTGGAGFIGSNFIHHLLRKGGHRVVNLDALTYAGNLVSLSDIEDDDRYVFVHGDIRDRALVTKLFSDYSIDSVVNFAAESYVDRSIKNPDLFLQSNVIGTQVLLEAARRSWQRAGKGSSAPEHRSPVRFIQVSAAEVYGDLGPTELFTEESRLAPRTPYAASKAAADLMALAYFDTYGLPVAITRSSSNFGPFQFPEKLIPLVIERCRAQLHVPLYGDGRQVRDWLHVDDHCTALDAVLERGRPGQVYNIGGGTEHSNLDVVRAVLTKLNANEALIEHVADRDRHDRRLALDNSSISELGWRPARTLEQGLDATIAWYAAHPEWLRQVTSGAYREYFRLYYSPRRSSS